MNRMSNEVDYRLAKMLFADMCSKGVIPEKKKKETMRRALLDLYAPPYGFLEQDDTQPLSDDEFSEMIGSKLTCGKCGRSYGTRPWHSTTYNDRVFDCLSRNVKKGFCGNSHIYAEVLPDIAKSIAGLLIKHRHIVEQFILKTYRAYDPEMLTEVHRYLGLIISEGTAETESARDGLLYIISGMVVNEHDLEIRLIDGTSVECKIPNYTPRRKIR